MVRKHRKIKLNNGGMSLVEVIMAITILSIVAVPVLHSLTTAMVYNAKARIRQDMTLKAESIMETFKGYDLETLQGMFAAGNGIDGIVKGTDCDDYIAPVYDFPAGPPAKDTALQYEIKGLKDDRDKAYDVTITVTSKGKQSVLEMEDIDPAKDAIYKGKTDYDKRAAGIALADFRSDSNKQAFVNYMSDVTFGGSRHGQALNADGNNISAGDVDADSFASYINLYERKIKFTISDDGSGNYVVTARMTYKYYIKNFPYYTPEETVPKDDSYYEEGETPPTVPEMEHFPSELLYLDQYPTGDPLEITIPVDEGNEPEPVIYKNPKDAGLNRLMVYYYPQYALDSGHDIIEIVNTAKNDASQVIDMNCYVLKQRALDISETRTSIFEAGYKATVKGNSTGTVFKLYHNFEENIGGGSPPADPEITGFTKAASYTTVDDFYKDEALLYDLELVVKDAATGNEITRFESSKNEKIKEK